MRSEYAIQNPEAAGLFRESCNVFSDAKSSIEQIICSFLKKKLHVPTYTSILVDKLTQNVSYLSLQVGSVGLK